MATKSQSSRRWPVGEMSYLSNDPLDVVRVMAEVQAPERGGVATFLGIVRSQQQGREVVRLDYSAYHEMAEAECSRVVAEAESRWPVKVALRHRLGTLKVGDVAVVVAVGGGHREESFAACRHVIEELKRRVPIWKREYFADGEVGWVGAGGVDGGSP